MSSPRSGEGLWWSSPRSGEVAPQAPEGLCPLIFSQVNCRLASSSTRSGEVAPQAPEGL